MTALSANRQTDRKDGVLVDRPAGVDILYQGGLVVINSSGYAVAGQDLAGARFGGVAYEKIDNSGGSNGDKAVRCWRKGLFSFAGSGFAITDVGKKVYLSDDQTVTLTPPGTGNVCVGVIAEYVSATEVLVDIEPAIAPQRFHRDTLYGSITAATTTSGGDAISLANPYGERVLVGDFVMDVSTPATGAANMDAGIGASASTSYDTLIDGVDVGSAAIVANNIDNKGSNGGRNVAWPSAHYITATPSATLAGLVGAYYVDVLVPTAW